MQKEFEEVLLRIDAMYKAKLIPKFKTLTKGINNNLTNLINILIRKSLLKENLYNYSNEELEKFFLPEEKQFMEVDKARVIFDRVKALMNAFYYISSNIPGDMFAINLNFLENIKKLLNNFAFNNFNSANSGINTRTLREMCDRILSSKDQLLKKIVQDNLKLLSDSYHKINEILDEFIRFKKEEYKIQIRFHVFPFLKEDEYNEKLLNDNPTAYLKKLTAYINALSPKIIFIKNWIIDALKSCYGAQPEEEIERLKAVFLTEEHKKDTHSIIHSPREKLLTLIDKTAKIYSILEKLCLYLDSNLKFTNDRTKNFIEQIMVMFKKAMNSGGEDDFYQLEYINPSNKNIENETININDFLISIKKKIILFKSITDKNSNNYEKIKKGTEESLFKFLEDTYFEMLLTKERILGIDAEMKLKSNKKTRPQFKEIKNEIELFDNELKNIGAERRKYVIEHDEFPGKQKKNNPHGV